MHIDLWRCLNILRPSWQDVKIHCPMYYSRRSWSLLGCQGARLCRRFLILSHLYLTHGHVLIVFILAPSEQLVHKPFFMDSPIHPQVPRFCGACQQWHQWYFSGMAGNTPARPRSGVLQTWKLGMLCWGTRTIKGLYLSLEWVRI